MKALTSSRGFTLAELLVVCAIIGILSAMSVGLVSRMQMQAKETAAMSGLNALATAYEMYYYHNRQYPQWGSGQKFTSPKAIWDELVNEDYLPSSYKKIEYEPTNGYIYGYSEDYAVDIKPYDGILSTQNSYFIVFHPYNFQRDALAIGVAPQNPVGWVAVRPRKGKEGVDYHTYRLFVPKRGGALD